MPHLPNFSPELVFSLYFLISYKKTPALFSMFSMWVICDMSFALIYDFPMFGSWSWFTYSALLLFFIASMILKWKVKLSQTSFILFSLSGSLVYWLWTNLGVWLLSGIYPHNSSGFIDCYFLALPFLGYSVLSSLFWASVLRMLFKPRLLYGFTCSN